MEYYEIKKPKNMSKEEFHKFINNYIMKKELMNELKGRAS
jgi:hypothetical protein